MDVLRGVALFGVFLVNFAAFAGAPIMATEQQLLSLPTAPRLHAVRCARWLFTDKANTMFAFLFGLGFYLQMQRLEVRGVDFEALYKRRLTVLLSSAACICSSSGPGTSCICTRSRDSSCCRCGGSRNRGLLVAGVLLAAFGRTAQKALAEFGSREAWSGLPGGYADSDMLLRQQISASGNYFQPRRQFLRVGVHRLHRQRDDPRLAVICARPLSDRRVGGPAWLGHARPRIPAGVAPRCCAWRCPWVWCSKGLRRCWRKSSWLPEWEHREFLAETRCICWRCRCWRLATWRLLWLRSGRGRPHAARAVRAGGPHGAD